MKKAGIFALPESCTPKTHVKFALPVLCMVKTHVKFALPVSRMVNTRVKLKSIQGLDVDRAVP